MHTTRKGTTFIKIPDSPGPEYWIKVPWYNEYRPHQALHGNTPTDVYDTTDPPATPDLPNSKLPRMEMHISYLDGRRHLPVIELKKVA